MRTCVYIDGFNLYYGSLRGTAFKWLDLRAMCELLLPRNDIRQIKYFTARVSARPWDPDQPTRQQTYFRALSTLPNCQIILGHFLVNETRMLRADSKPDRPRWVQVMKTEEKGSDVNLATHLLMDGYDGRYDVAVVITNDSDLVEPIKVVRERLGKIVGVVYPTRKVSYALKNCASFVKRIRTGVLRESQFSLELQDKTGPFEKPDSW